MSDTFDSHNTISPSDQLYAELLEEITARVEANESVDAEAYIREYPQFSARIRAAVPALQALQSLGVSDNSRTRSIPSTGDSVADPIGDYRILRELGRGGMGVVYEAEQMSLGRRVALKILPFAALLNERQLERFATEATAAARLQHAHIVPIYTVGCERGIHFYAMQLIDGPSLAEVIAELRQVRDTQGSPATAEQRANTDTVVDRAAAVLTRDADGKDYYRAVARIGREAADALQYAHEHGVLHRDIKPSNLLLDAGGHVWIADFGLARVEDESHLTRTGDVLGTLRYMSPEQATGQRDTIDARSDVYSLGATLYELATLQPIFNTADRRQIVKRLITGNSIVPHKFDRRVPKQLSLIIGQALARRPNDRYQSAQLLADDLRRFLEGQPIQATQRTPLRRTRDRLSRHHLASAVTVGLLVVALTASGITHQLFRRSPTQSAAQASVKNYSSAAFEEDASTAVSKTGSNRPATKKPSIVASPEIANLEVAAVSGTSITLRWQSAGDTKTTYRVAYNLGTEYPPIDSRWDKVINVGSVAEYEVGGLRTGQVYSFRVSEVNARGTKSVGATVRGTCLRPEYYIPLDTYADFSPDEPTYLGFGSIAVQPDGKFIVTANAQPNVAPYCSTGGEHFVGRLNSDGSVDVTFGAGGYHRMDILHDGDTTFDYPSNAIVLPDGKILVAGTLGGDIGYRTTAWYIVNYNPDGTLDTAFGEGGVVLETVADVEVAKGFTIDVRPDGKIVAAGSLARAGGTIRCAVVQYNADGSRDADFGINRGTTEFCPLGMWGFDTAYRAEQRSMMILEDGSIAVTGAGEMTDGRFVSCIVMFGHDGVVNMSFGKGGYTFVDTWPEVGPNRRIGWELLTGIVEQPDGKLLVCGSRGGFQDDVPVAQPYQRTLARFNADGSVDTTFGINGIVVPTKVIDCKLEAYRAVAIESNQKIVALGWAGHTVSDARFYNIANVLTIERFNDDGSRDVSFNGTGRIEFGTPATQLLDQGLILENGDLVIGSTRTDVETGRPSRILLLRLISAP